MKIDEGYNEEVDNEINKIIKQSLSAEEIYTQISNIIGSENATQYISYLGSI